MSADSLARLLDGVRKDRQRLVPFLGAGLAGEAGAPTATDLLQALKAAAGARYKRRRSLFVLADDLEAVRGTLWVQKRISEAIRAASVSATPTLLAIVRAPSRIVVTTNYDESIEAAATEAGFRVRVFLPEGINEALVPPRHGTVHVLHLHGIAADPESIILTKESYRKASEDERIAFGLRELAAQFQLVFLGSSLAARELHVWRDLTWSRNAFRNTGPHYLVLSQYEFTNQGFGDLQRITGIEPIAHADAPGSYETSKRAAQIVGGVSSFAGIDFIPPTAQPLDWYFLPVPMAPAREVSTHEQRQVWAETSRFLGGELALGDLGRHSRILLIGDPGVGKSQTLLKIASDSPHAVLLKLGGVHPAVGAERPADKFVAWMAGGVAVRSGVPRVTSASLREGLYDFLLDGLDEAPPPLRAGILEMIESVAAEHPQHRYVVATRVVPEIEASAARLFERLVLVPRDDWLQDYFRHRGLTVSQLDSLLSTVPRVRDLLRTPMYAAAAADLLLKGEEVPDSPLELLGLLAERGFEPDEPKLAADPEAVRVWLDRIALAMELLGISEVDAEEFLASGLEGGLNLQSDRALLETIVLRVLLMEAGGDRVRFPANALQEARAAKTLLSMRSGLKILRRFVLLSIMRRKGIRQTWSHTLDLLLTAAPREWREAVEPFDPVAVARTTSPTAGPRARTAAIRSIWSWYARTRIWIPRRTEQQLLDDERAIQALARLGVPNSLISQLERASRSRDPVIRGNAVAVLGVLGEREVAEQVARRLIRDTNPVVRRRAAEVADDLGASELAEEILSQLESETDELAIQTLTATFIVLAPNRMLRRFLRADHPQPLTLFPALDRRWSREKQLKFLEQARVVDEDWLEHLLGTTEAWSEQEARILIRILMSQPERPLQTTDRARQALLHYPQAVLAAGLELAASRVDALNLAFLMREVGVDELRRLKRTVKNQVAKQALAEVLAWRTKPASPLSTQRPPRERPRLPRLLESGDVDVILASDLARDVADLTAADLEKLQSIVERAWMDWSRVHGSPARSITVRGEQASMPRRVWELLEFGEAVRLDLPYGEWRRLARLPLQTRQEWLGESFDPSWLPRVEAELGRWPRRSIGYLAEILPPPWSKRLAGRLSRRVFAGTVEGEFARRVCAIRLAENGQRSVLRALSARYPDLFLVEARMRAGDCEAEVKLIETLARPDQLEDRMSGLEPGEHWITGVRCPSSAPRLARLVAKFARDEGRAYEMSKLYQALSRCDALFAVKTYEKLMRDPTLPLSGFFWYQREEALAVLFERQARQRLPGSLGGFGRILVPAGKLVNAVSTRQSSGRSDFAKE